MNPENIDTTEPLILQTHQARAILQEATAPGFTVAKDQFTNLSSDIPQLHLLGSYSRFPAPYIQAFGLFLTANPPERINRQSSLVREHRRFLHEASPHPNNSLRYSQFQLATLFYDQSFIPNEGSDTEAHITLKSLARITNYSERTIGRHPRLLAQLGRRSINLNKGAGRPSIAFPTQNIIDYFRIIVPDALTLTLPET